MNNSITKDRVENYLICTAHCLEKVDLTVSMDSVLSQWALLMLVLKDRPGNNFSDVLALSLSSDHYYLWASLPLLECFMALTIISKNYCT